MKEITRIHIAKVPYDIETAAKKEIENYISALEKYANDAELMQDIEIRITELLAQRGVITNGVIGIDDVKSIRDQLGEPSEFMSDSPEVDSEIDISGVNIKKLYRNKDNAIIGGVLSGMASYFNVDPLWVRILFIVLFFITSGAALFLYIVLWVIIPSANTAAEKLIMTGRPVNIESIKELNEQEIKMTSNYERASLIRRILTLFMGSMLSIASIGTIAFTIVVGVNIIHPDILQTIQPGSEWVYVCSYILAIIAGLLLSTLFAILSYVVFAQKLTKRIAVSIATIIISGLLSFGTATGLVMYQSVQSGDYVQRNMVDIVIAVPADFSKINSLIINSKTSTIEYVVSDNPKITMNSLPGTNKPTIKINGSNASIDFEDNVTNHWPIKSPVVTIYGPKLDILTLKNSNVSYTSNANQALNIEASEDSIVNLYGGTYEILTINASEESQVSASDATVQKANVSEKTSAAVSLGVIEELVIVHPKACPQNGNSTVSVNAVSSGSITYNESKIGVEDYESNCGSLIINN